MKYYFIGICGISMRSLAVLVKLDGNDVVGSDIAPSDLEFLRQYGIEVFEKSMTNEVEKADVVVVSSAIGEDDVDLTTARKFKRKIISRGELLGEIASKYEKVIAIAGAHGKTTTTALIYNILKDRRPTLHLGGVLKEENTSLVCGGKEFFITEACEYHDNFLYLKPHVAVITNIEREHLDYFKTFENELLSFERFRKNSSFVIEGDGDYQIENIKHIKGKLAFDICYKKKIVMSLKMNICEDVNATNALFAYRTCKLLGVSDEKIKVGLESFKGVKRRFESVKSKFFKNAIVDYAHHPTEIKNTIKTSKAMFKKVVFIFQPHTFSRTKELLKEFVDVFKDEENLVIFKTFPAREKENDGVSGRELANLLHRRYFEDVELLMTYLKLNYSSFTPIFIGAGDLPRLLEERKYIE